MPDRRLPLSRVLSLAPTAVCAFFLFCNLGKPALWQDEAETALLARSVLRHGTPLVRDSGMLITGQHSLAPQESNERGVWTWNTWLPYYLGAASFGLLGEGAWPARLPFALAALLAYLLARSLFRSFARGNRPVETLSAWFLALDVPWLLFMRQCRYYSLASLGVLAAIWSYRELLAGRSRGRWALVASALWLFQSFFAYGAVALAALALDAWLRRKSEPEFLRRFTAVAAVTLVLMLPQAAYFRVWARPGNHAYSLAEGANFLRTFLLWIHQFSVSSPLLLAYALCLPRQERPAGLRAPAALCGAWALLVAALSGEGAAARWTTLAAFCALAAGAARLPAPRGEIGPARMILLWATCALGLFSLTGAEPYGRYLAPLLPLACFGMGALTAEVGRRLRISPAALAAALLACDALYVLPVRALSALGSSSDFFTVSGAMRARLRDVPLRSDLARFSREVLSGREGYVEPIAARILRDGRPGDTVFSDADNLSLMFYLDRRQPEPGELEARPPDWIVPSPWLQLKPDLELSLRKLMAASRYETVSVPAPMTLWQDNPDILFHVFEPSLGERTLYRKLSP